MAFTALTAVGRRSLVDDTSTTKSDADTTLATEDTYPLKHESDMMLVQQNSTNTAASSRSENSRVYMDDDDEEAVNNHQSHYHMEDDHSNYDDNLSWDASKRPMLNGGSSVNTGSTYEETPFLLQKYSASAVRAHQGQKNGDLNHLQAQQEQSSLQQPQNQDGYDQDNESFSWQATEFTNAPSATDEPGDSGYACEMIVETQNMLQQAKIKADDCLKNMFPHPASNTDKVSTNDESSPSSGRCASLQHVVSFCGDGIDGILVKLFHVSENADARNQPPSKYAVSVNESLTNNLKHVLHAAVRSEPTASRSQSKKKKTRKVSQSNDDVSRPSASPEVFLVPLATSADESTGGDLRDMQHDDHEEHSDIRDDLDDVLGETYSGEFGGGQDPLSKYKDTYDSDSVDKRESTSTASSINSDIGREKTEMGRDGLCDSASVARMLEKYSERKGALDERRAKLVAMSRDDDVAGSDLSLFSLHQKHVQQLLQKTGPSQFDKTDNSNVTTDDDSSGNVRVSSLYGRHVVNLINKNLDATNRSKSINFSHVDVGDDDEFLDTETLKSFAAGRSWHSKVRTEKEVEKSTEIDFELDTAAEPSWHSSSIVDEIDMTLHKRKEKLRKLMDDLSLTMDVAVNGKLQLKKSQYIIDAEAERGIGTEDQTNHVPVQAIDQPIDLTKQNISSFTHNPHNLREEELHALFFALFFTKMLASTTSRSPNMATAASKMALRATGASLSGTQNGEQRRTILGISKALDKRLYRMAKGVMPNISQTEQVALGCGTIGFDRDIFTGSPSLKHLVDTYKPKLTAEEQSFLDNETNKLCELLNDHDVSMAKDFNKEVWDYMRDQGFFALKIPKEWGGKGFSTHAVSQILVKLSTQSFDANATVAVPNSLGPGELLARYGTDEQKEYFLPRLADGTLIPCFGLTGPHSGSDATSLIQSDCVVEERNGELGVVASFKKRYITLAPVAGVVGLGLNLSDPKGLLKGVGAEGFSVALLERDHPGLRMGRRHMPLNAAFMNGTVEGDDVWIPMSNILGGQERCGFGWHMFVECLAEGRGVSLPAGSAGCGRGVVSAVGAYTRVRKQFRVPIAEFGGIQEALSLAGSDALITIAGTDLMNAIIDNHEAPMVVSSIMKQNCTERGRRIVERGMDIAAGSAICRGDKNYLGNAYMSLPIAITVEGANIMTRSFQIIGQGLTRCHPHMLELIYSLQAPKEKEDEAIKTFTNQFYKVVNHGLTNFFHSITRGVGSTVSTKFRSSKAYKDGDKLLEYHEKQLLRLSANFALTADLCFTLGGRLKFEELLMGRLADAMGAIFLGYSTLHHYSRNRGVDGLEAITEHAMLRLEKEALDALKEASDNFPGPLGTVASTIMKMGCFPLGSITRPYSPPTDSLTKEVSHLLTNPSGLRDMFQENIYVAPEGVAHQVSDLIRALPVCVEADKIASTLRREKREPTLEEADKIAKAEAMRDILIQVNAFDHLTDAEGQEGYVRPALLGTEERLAALERKRFA